MASGDGLASRHTVDSETPVVEAKGTAERSAIRMIIGQLADYRRFISPSPMLAALLPSRPRPDLEELLLAHGIASVWPTGTSFADNASGALTLPAS